MIKNITKEQILQAKQRLQIVGDTPGLNRAIEISLLIAPTDCSVLVTGESGVGKESFPKLIHQHSLRKHGPYITVNCGAIPEGTIDSELFGHKKGSFTDAVTERQGYFEVADGGTIFLDEIGEMPLPTQSRLLRILESGEFMKVGSSQVQHTDIRVIAATNVKLQDAVSKGKFREDLYYRLNTVTIELPPLRERGKDILLLFRKFIADFADRYQMPPIRLSEDAQALLLRYEWPGNIRQLRNIAHKISVLSPEREVTEKVMKDFLPANAGERHPVLITSEPALFRNSDTFSRDIPNHFSNTNDTSYRDFEILDNIYGMTRDIKGNIHDLAQLLYRILQNQQQSQNPSSPNLIPQIATATRSDIHPSFDNIRTIEAEDTSPEHINPEIHTLLSVLEEKLSNGKIMSLDELERHYIELLLKKNKGSRKKTAEDLDISERTLYRKINK